MSTIIYKSAHEKLHTHTYIYIYIREGEKIESQIESLANLFLAIKKI